MPQRTSINVVFVIATVILSLHTVPYRIMLCSAPRSGDSPEALAAGIASTPYQYRVLIPWVVRAAVETHLIRPEGEHTAFAVIETVSLVLLGFVFRRYLSLFIENRVLASMLALSLYAVLPFNYFNYVFYPYDIPAVVFFTSGLLLIRKERWLWFYPLFALATLNRETSIFLVVVVVLVLCDKYDWRMLSVLAGSQIAIWVAIKAALWALYHNNPTHGHGLFEFQLKVNVATILAFPIRGIMTLSTWGCLWLAVLAWYPKIEDAFLKRTLWMVPVFVAGMLVVGFVTEMRVYGEVVPVILAAFSVIFLRLVEGAVGHPTRHPERSL